MIFQKRFMDQRACGNHGFVVLTSVMVISAICVAIAVSVILLGLGSSRTGFAVVQSTQARFIADSCAEEALQKLRESVYYTGNQSLTFSIGSCQIQTITGVGNFNRTIPVVGTVGTMQRKVKVIVGTVHPTISITSWQEVADF